MNQTHGPDGDRGQDELELYIDGLLDDERRAAFERQLHADPELAAELERQRSLDARLTAAFPVPEDPSAIAQRALSAARPPRAAGRRLSLLRVAVAASVLAAFGLWAVSTFDDIDDVDETPMVVVHKGAGTAIDGSIERIQQLGSPGPDAAQVEQSCMAYGGLYTELAAEWRLGTAAPELPQDLARHFRDRLGHELMVNATDLLPIEGPFTIRRWPTTTLLVSPQEPEPILILVDTRARDPQPALEAGSPAHLFRRELGDLVLYELTPWETSRALDLFRLR